VCTPRMLQVLCMVPDMLGGGPGYVPRAGQSVAVTCWPATRVHPSRNPIASRVNLV
jgi:hypothetical protein